MPTSITNPTAGDVHVNRPLTNFSQQFLQSSDSYASLKAFPNIPVSKQSDLYYTFDREDFFRDEAKERADGSESSGGGFDLSTDPYFARVYAFHKDVTDRQRANQDDVLNLERSSTNFVTQKLMITRERVFAETFLADNVWFNGGSAAAAPEATDWASVTGQPIEQVRAAITGVHTNTGMRPNRILVSRTRHDQLMDNDEILARITGGATTTIPARVQRQLLAELFEVESYEVADAVSNTSVKGAAAQNFNFIGADRALVYYAPSAAGIEEPSAGMQFSWTGLFGSTSEGVRVKRFRKEENEADRIEGQMAFDYRVTSPELGHLFA